MYLAAGTVSSVPISPPMLNQLVAWAFQLSASASVAARSSPCAAASTLARPLAITGMNALQLHHRTSAVRAVIRPLMVAGRTAAVNNSATLGGVLSFLDTQRSGSLTKNRTRSATAAGSRPLRNT